MSDKEVNTAMTADFREEIRQELGALEERVAEFSTSHKEMKKILVKCVVVGAMTLTANIGAFAWQASQLWTEAQRASQLAEQNAKEIRVIAGEQIRQEKLIGDIAELRTELRMLREVMQATRDDVILMKAERRQ